MRRTPLFDAHRAAGARMVEFAGWAMPLHYGSQIEEHHAVRRDAGVFYTSHMLALDLEGVRAAGFLRRAAGEIAIRPRRDLAMLAVQGPRAREKAWAAFPALKTSTARLELFSSV